jgi:hypothetical protein
MNIEPENRGPLPNPTPPGRVPARHRAKQSRFTKTAVVLAVVLGAGAGTTAVAQAATTASADSAKATAPRAHFRSPAAAGTVESVGTGTFSVKAHNGTTVIVDVSTSTTYRDRKVTSATFANVTTGEMVTVEGTTASGVVTATRVSIGFGGGRGHNHWSAAATGG